MKSNWPFQICVKRIVFSGHSVNNEFRSKRVPLFTVVCIIKQTQYFFHRSFYSKLHILSSFANADYFARMVERTNGRASERANSQY